MCAAELADLVAFRQTLKSEPRGRRWRQRLLVPAFALAAVAAIVLVLALPTEAPAPAPDPLRAGLASFPAEDRAAAEEALRSGRIAVSPEDPELVRTRETLLGAEAPVAVLKPVAPVGNTVFTDRPGFQWTGPAGARDFVVEVYDANFEKVLTSPMLQDTIWYATKALTRGQAYSWTVTATIGGARVTAPKAPEPEAKFRVLGEAGAAQLEGARNAQPVSDLRVAVTAARLGLRDEARAALDRLAARYPNSGAARLRDSVPAK